MNDEPKSLSAASVEPECHHNRVTRECYQCKIQILSAAEPETEDAARLQGEIDFQSGRIRRREGARLIDNPYPRETQGAQDWERGWKVEHYEQLHDAQQLKASACECPSRSALVKGMVDRFLSWRLPDNFNPDGGVTFSPHRDAQGWPVGTNLLDADQADAMVRHILSADSPCPCVGLRERLALLEGPFHGAAPAGTSQADIVRARAAITDAYIRDGEPAQKVNWMYAQAITQLLRAEAAEAELAAKQQAYEQICEQCASAERELNEEQKANDGLRAELTKANDTWRCFHCGFETSNPAEAEAHFGERDDAAEFSPTCTWWAKLSQDERAQEFQDLQQELNSERDESGRLNMKNEGLEHRLIEFENVIDSRFKGARSINDIFHLYDTMEGLKLLAEQELTASQERECKLRAEVKVRPFDPGFPTVPERHRSRRSAYDAGYSAGWRGRDPGRSGYTSIHHIIAYDAGYAVGVEESAAEIDRLATPEGTRDAD